MFEAVGETKVCDDDVSVAIEEKVLEFEVAVNDFLLMDVPDTRYELGEELCSILLLEITMGKDVVEELATGGVLEDDANVLVCLDDVVQTDDVWVFERLACKMRRDITN